MLAFWIGVALIVAGLAGAMFADAMSAGQDMGMPRLDFLGYIGLAVSVIGGLIVAGQILRWVAWSD